ncbi:hypothetical protein MalM25_31460 [Planctomycetes bacterium MalM25]|nr:hypothetical protein MalM25_31460 [Planctomycetes bacterium MalM25]
MGTRSCWRFGFFLLCVAGLLGQPTAARGQITDLSITSAPCPHLDGFVVNQLRIDFEGQLFGQELQVALDSGAIYQDAINDNRVPLLASVNLFPSMACDSFVGIGEPVPSPFDPPWSPWPGDSTFDEVLIIRDDFVDGAWDIAWAPSTGVVIDSGEDYFIAQVTLSEDAEGSWDYSGNAGGQPFQIAGASISGGVMRLVPEPTTMSLLVLSALSVAAGRCPRA